MSWCPKTSGIAAGRPSDQGPQALDHAYASFCTAQLARGLGDLELHEQMMGLSDLWRNALDPATGRLPGGNYYEGGNWTYSFRLLHNMADATLNGEPIDRPYLRYAEMAAGGRLVLKVGPEPSPWGRATRPPSHPAL